MRTLARPRHVRHRVFERMRHATSSIRRFLAAQATRLADTASAQTFTANATSNRLTISTHGLSTGDGPFVVSNSGGALPGGLVAGTLYWVRVIDADTVELTLTREAVTGATLVDITSAGSGTHSIELAETAPAILEWSRRGRKPRHIAAVSDIDDL